MAVFPVLHERRAPLAQRGAVLPSLLTVHRDMAAVREELAAIVQLAHAARKPKGAPGGLVPVSAASRKPDPLANLWFSRAAAVFFLHARDPLDQVFAADVLLPMRKQIVQEFVGAGIGGIRMDDGGMLAPATRGKAPPSGWLLRLNALWYCTMESTAAALRAAAAAGAPRDHAAEHFERLAGRFRRSFAKNYWCEEHGRVCAPETRGAADHGVLPDAEQLLVTALPASPLPRTKQRQLLVTIMEKVVGAQGVLLNHPFHGLVESVLHRAWLVQGLVANADGAAALLAEAARLAAPLRTLYDQAATTGLCALYRDGMPIARQKPDPLTTGEVMAAIALTAGVGGAVAAAAAPAPAPIGV